MCSRAEPGNKLRTRTCQCDGERRGVRAAVRDRDEDLANAELLDYIAGAAAKSDAGAAAFVVADLDVAPAYAAPPTGANRLKDGFFSGPAAGEMLRGLLAAAAVFDLRGRIHAVDEQLAVPLDHLRDPQALHNIGSNTENIHRGSVGSTGGSGPGRGAGDCVAL